MSNLSHLFTNAIRQLFGKAVIEPKMLRACKPRVPKTARRVRTMQGLATGRYVKG
jgi:hypothetical protein